LRIEIRSFDFLRYIGNMPLPRRGAGSRQFWLLKERLKLSLQTVLFISTSSGGCPTLGWVKSKGADSPEDILRLRRETKTTNMSTKHAIGIV